MTAAERALHALCVYYRKFELSRGVLYLCKSEEGTAFDLAVCDDGSYALWRYVAPDLPKGREGTRVHTELDGAEVGFYVTEERMLCFYSKGRDANRFFSQLCSFLKLIKTTDFVKEN